MAIIRGTTPSYTISVNGIDLKKIKSIYITFGQNGKELFTIREDNVTVNTDDSTLAIHLTQEQTLKFDNRESVAQMQIRLYGEDGNAEANTISNIGIQPILHEGVIS